MTQRLFDLAGLLAPLLVLGLSAGLCTPAARAGRAASQPDGVLDVKLGLLSGISQWGRVGFHPDGRAGLTMSTTSCNVGDVEVNWNAPMEEDHPMIAMQLYREKNGRFEQIGASWLKHGFFAQASTACGDCEPPNPIGPKLGVGCSDTYGVANNSDRFWLGPREEVNAYTGVWTCTGSYFSGGEPDCERRENGSGLDGAAHRLDVADADLGDTDATYYYEAAYLVRDDQNKMNNFGSRTCTMTNKGGNWSFVTPHPGVNPLVEGPAVLRWGEMHGFASTGSADGQVVLGVQTTDQGLGFFRYEYAVFNFDSHRKIRSFSIPLGGAVPLDTYFRDPDHDPGNDWSVSFDADRITWSTDTFETDPGANALGFALLFTFGFETNRVPQESHATLGVFAPASPAAAGQPDVTFAATMGPEPFTPIAPGGAPPGGAPPVAVVLGAPRPNPAGGVIVVPFSLERPARVDLSVFDATGRWVARLAGDRRAPGTHRVAWDGHTAAGASAAAGVYHVRLTADGRPAGSRRVVRVD